MSAMTLQSTCNGAPDIPGGPRHMKLGTGAILAIGLGYVTHLEAEPRSKPLLDFKGSSNLQKCPVSCIPVGRD